MASRLSFLSLLVASLTPAAASASYWLVMDPAEVTQSYVDRTLRVDARATKNSDRKLLSSLMLRINGREVNVPAEALARIEWPRLATMQLQRASEKEGWLFVSIECACGRPEGGDAMTARIAFEGDRYEDITIESFGE